MQSGIYTAKRNKTSQTSAFTLVEVALSIAVMAIGLLGVLVLFPVGLDATRTASDNTEVTTIGAEYLSIYQQAALSISNYAHFGPPGVLLKTDVLDPTSSIQTNWIDSTAFFLSRITVDNTSFAQIRTTNSIPTNLVSRVIIDLWRPGGNTNTYVTEVARYALQ